MESTLQPGMDTLQENADKERFFAELEGSCNTPLDYSELNRQLENTGKSLPPDTTRYKTSLSACLDYYDRNA